MRIEIKPKYGHDALDRGLGIGTYITENQAAMVLESTPAQLEELISDAEHYATPGQFSSHNRGLVLSAKASLKMIKERIDP